MLGPCWTSAIPYVSGIRNAAYLNRAYGKETEGSGRMPKHISKLRVLTKGETLAFSETLKNTYENRRNFQDFVETWLFA